MKKKPETQNQEFVKLMSKSIELFLLNLFDEKINGVPKTEKRSYKKILKEMLQIPKIRETALTQWFQFLESQGEKDVETQLTQNFTQVYFEQIERLKTTTEDSVVSQNLQCPICLDIFEQPHVVNQTGQIYCANCIGKHLVVNRKTDPVTNEQLQDDSHKKSISKHSHLEQHKENFIKTAKFLLNIFSRNAELFLGVKEEVKKKLPIVYWVIKRCLKFKKGFIEFHEHAELFIELCKKNDEKFYMEKLDEFCIHSLEYCKVLGAELSGFESDIKLYEKAREVLNRRTNHPVDMMIDLYYLMLGTKQSTYGSPSKKQPMLGVDPRRCQDVIEMVMCIQKRDGDNKAAMKIHGYLLEAPKCIAWLEFRARVIADREEKAKIFCIIGNLWMENEPGDADENLKQATIAFNNSFTVSPNVDCFKGLAKIYVQKKETHKASMQYFRMSKLFDEKGKKIECLMNGWKIERENKVILRNMMDIFAADLQMNEINKICEQLSGVFKLEMQNYGHGKFIEHQNHTFRKFMEQTNKEISTLKEKNMKLSNIVIRKCHWIVGDPGALYEVVGEYDRFVVKTDGPKTVVWAQTVKEYYKVKIVKIPGNGGCILGVCKREEMKRCAGKDNNHYVGCDENSIGMYSVGNSFYYGGKNIVIDLKVPFGVGDIVGVRVNYPQSSVSFSVEKKDGTTTVCAQNVKNLKFSKDDPVYPAVYLYAKGAEAQMVEIDNVKI